MTLLLKRNQRKKKIKRNPMNLAILLVIIVEKMMNLLAVIPLIVKIVKNK